MNDFIEGNRLGLLFCVTIFGISIRFEPAVSGLVVSLESSGTGDSRFIDNGLLVSTWPAEMTALLSGSVLSTSLVSSPSSRLRPGRCNEST